MGKTPLKLTHLFFITILKCSEYVTVKFVFLICEEIQMTVGRWSRTENAVRRQRGRLLYYEKCEKLCWCEILLNINSCQFY